MSASTPHDASAAFASATLEQAEESLAPTVDAPTPRRGRPIELGSSNFVKLRKFGRLYVDKSPFISHVLEAGPEVMLCTRPRRFGKTTNLAMLQAFFEKRDEDFTAYFQDLAIWKDAAAREHFQRYPVIFFTFKDCKARTWEHCRAQLHATIQNTFQMHRTRWEAPNISPSERQGMDALLYGSAPPEAYEQSAFRLSQFLSRISGESVLLLIDEYDSPIHAGVENGFYHEVIDFFRTFFGSALKDNHCLFKCVITGIMRVSKEGLFSALNNLRVYTVLSDEFQADFGFTEPEVEALLQEWRLSDRLLAIRRTYNGYRVGRNKFVDLYNPWSMLAYLNSSAFTLDPYWMNTGSTELIDALVYQLGDRIRKPLETLLTGGAITCLYNDSLTFQSAGQNGDSLFTFLLHAGYLKPKQLHDEHQRCRLLLEVPNQEVRLAYIELGERWLKSALGSLPEDIRRFTRALLEGHTERLQEGLQLLLLKHCSFMDPGTSQREKFYHGLVLGLLVTLEQDFQVSSNTESGFGRVDMLIRPRKPGSPGVALELKVCEPSQSLDEALLDALLQAERQRYATVLEQAGASPIHMYGVAFDGKRVKLALAQDKALIEARIAAELEARELNRLAQKQAQEQERLTKEQEKLKAKEHAKAKPRTRRSPRTSLSLEERLALEDKMVPHLSVEELQLLWVRLGLLSEGYSFSNRTIVWNELLTRCEQSGQLGSLAKLLELKYPPLAGEPLLSLLKEK